VYFEGILSSSVIDQHIACGQELMRQNLDQMGTLMTGKVSAA
jgi:hypothetical protein